ncbi:LysR family transcriptional regulator [uncultured Intestinimonas sp.]|uniref:LysR family transcriptional regulator n=1 Tax=uncultured Intestinimonas sp. TaxID=1689265 RepID=UPI00344DE29B
MSTVELSQLKYFRAVAKVQNMSKAAAELYVTQPTLSQSIKHLEEELGVKLFDRSGKSVILNDCGKKLLGYTDQIFALVDEAKGELADVAAKNDSVVSVSINTSSNLLIGLLPDFTRQYPDIRFRIMQNDWSQPDADDFDLCINSSSSRPEGINVETILKERILLALPLDHPLAARDTISFQDLRQESFIQVNGKELQDHLYACCQEAGFEPNVAFVCDFPTTVCDFVEMGIGVALFPEITWYNPVGRGIVLRPLQERTSRRYISVSWRSSTYLSRNARLFRDHLIGYMREHYPLPDTEQPL